MTNFRQLTLVLMLGCFLLVWEQAHLPLARAIHFSSDGVLVCTSRACQKPLLRPAAARRWPLWSADRVESVAPPSGSQGAGKGVLEAGAQVDVNLDQIREARSVQMVDWVEALVALLEDAEL